MFPKILKALRDALGHRWGRWGLVALAVVTSLPALNEGWVLDDLILRMRLLDPSEVSDRARQTGWIPEGSHELPAAMMDLFSWAGRGAVEAWDLMHDGVAPWWTYPDITLAFWRPLAAATHWLDYQLWPHSVALMHAHSIFWFALYIALVWALYRRLMEPAWVAGLAALLYTVDEVIYEPVAWVSNRNTLLAGLFGVLALLAHDRWRREGARRGAILAFVWLALAYLSAEAAVAFMGYLVAYALFLDRGGWRQRALSLVPSVSLTVAWRLLHQTLGYGAVGSGLYLDPSREPLRYAAGVLERGPVQMFSQWTGLGASDYSALPVPGRERMWLLSVAFLVFLLLAAWPLLRRSATARFWAAGMALAMVPGCSVAMADERFLFFVGLGAMGLSAQFLAGVMAKVGYWVPSTRLWRVPAWIACLALLWVDFGLAGYHRFQIVQGRQGLEWMVGATNAVGDEPEVAEELEEQIVVLVGSPSPYFQLFLPFGREVRGLPVPRRVRTLAPIYSPLEVTREDVGRLRIRALSGSFMHNESFFQPGPPQFEYLHQDLSLIFRGPGVPLREGELVPVWGMTVEVVRLAEDGWPAEAVFHFDRPLEEPSLRWLTWSWERFGWLPFPLPAMGESVVVSG